MKIGIIGCGGIARAHVNALKNIRNRELVFCDRNPSKSDALARGLSDRPTYDDPNNLLHTEKPDAVHILTQLPSHTALARTALEAGAHVYIEKPITETVAEFNQLLSLAASSKKHLCAGYSTLGLPVVRKAKALIASGKLGRLVTVHCDFNWTASGNSIPYGRLNHWAYSLKGGILQNIIDHPMSLVVDAMGDVEGYETLFCKRNQLPNDCPDLIQVGLKNSDQIGSVSVSFGHGNTHAQAQFCLEAGTIWVDLRRQLWGCFTGKGPESFSRKAFSGLKLASDIGFGTLRNATKRAIGAQPRDAGIAGLVNNFHAAIDGKEELIVGAPVATQTIAILEQIWTDMKASH